MDKNCTIKIQYEISQIDELIDKAQILIGLCKTKEPDFIELTSAGAILHSFYNGLENIFVLIAKSLNYSYNLSPSWHRELVDFIFQHPYFVTSDLRLQLTKYLGFRHFFRHAYGF